MSQSWSACTQPLMSIIPISQSGLASTQHLMSIVPFGQAGRHGTGPFYCYLLRRYGRQNSASELRG